MKLRKIAAVLLAALLVLGAMPVYAVEADGETEPDVLPMAADAETVASGNCGKNGDNLQWTLDSNGTLTISGTGEMADYEVTNQSPWWNYSFRIPIQKIDIQTGVTSIGKYAFGYCDIEAKSVSIPSTVSAIWENAFSGCDSLEEIVIPEQVTSILPSTFYDCTALKRVTLPSRLGSIRSYAFYGCSALENIELPSTLKTIENGAFSGCASLKNIVIPDAVTSIESNTFYNCSSLTSVIVPNSVTEIKAQAFSGCISLADITIPDGVTSIGHSAFKNCISLTNVTLPDSITSIELSMFEGCTSLASVTIPDNVTYIGENAFYSCPSLKSVTLPKDTRNIGPKAFGYCGLLDEYGYSDGEQKVDGFTLIGYDGSAAETYAKDNGFTFVPLDMELPVAISRQLTEKISSHFKVSKTGNVSVGLTMTASGTGSIRWSVLNANGEAVWQDSQEVDGISFSGVTFTIPVEPGSYVFTLTADSGVTGPTTISLDYAEDAEPTAAPTDNPTPGLPEIPTPGENQSPTQGGTLTPAPSQTTTPSPTAAPTAIPDPGAQTQPETTALLLNGPSGYKVAVAGVAPADQEALAKGVSGTPDGLAFVEIDLVSLADGTADHGKKATVCIAYPEEAKDYRQYDYRLYHLVDGAVEQANAIVTAEGLLYEGTFSPFSIAYTKKAEATPAPTAKPTAAPTSRPTFPTWTRPTSTPRPTFPAWTRPTSTPRPTSRPTTPTRPTARPTYPTWTTPRPTTPTETVPTSRPTFPSWTARPYPTWTPGTPNSGTGQTASGNPLDTPTGAENAGVTAGLIVFAGAVLGAAALYRKKRR